MTRTFILQRVLASNFCLPDALASPEERERGAEVTGAAAPDFLQPWHEVEGGKGKVE